MCLNVIIHASPNVILLYLGDCVTFFWEAFVSTLALETLTVNWLLPCAACLTVTVTLTCYWKTVFTVLTVKALVSPSGWVCFTLINNKMCV